MPTSSETPLFAAIRRVFEELSPERQRSILPLMALMLLGALAELISIGTLLPFPAAMVNPARVTDFAAANMVFQYIGADTPRRVLYVLTIIFVTATLFASVLRLVLLRTTFKFVYGVAYELGVRLYSDALYQPYIYHTKKNSSELISAINKAHLVTIEIFFPLMQAAVAIVIASFIIGGLIWIDPVVAVISGAGFSAIYVLTSMASRKQLRRNSLIVAETQGARVQAMQEGLGGIRDIILDRSQPVFIETYERAEARLRDARARNSFVAFAPRFIVEGLGMALIAGAAPAMTGRRRHHRSDTRVGRPGARRAAPAAAHAADLWRMGHGSGKPAEPDRSPGTVAASIDHDAGSAGRHEVRSRDRARRCQLSLW